MNLNKIVNFIQDLLPETPKTALILGSGLGDFILQLQDPIYIPYKKIPEHPCSSVSGHKSEWVFGYLNEKPIICASGRFHYYEGFLPDQVTLPVSIVHALGCQNLLISNTTGCLVREWEIGDFMIINGYIDYSFKCGPHVPSIVLCNQDIVRINRIKKIAKDISINLREGIYAWTLGPSYETHSEIKDIKLLKGDVVGMSAGPELLKAHELNMDILGISCITNYGAGLVDEKLTHDTVLKNAGILHKKFSDFVRRIVID